MNGELHTLRYLILYTVYTRRQTVVEQIETGRIIMYLYFPEKWTANCETWRIKSVPKHILTWQRMSVNVFCVMCIVSMYFVTKLTNTYELSIMKWQDPEWYTELCVLCNNIIQRTMHIFSFSHYHATNTIIHTSHLQIISTGLYQVRKREKGIE